jgi:hypothetical protein
MLQASCHLQLIEVIGIYNCISVELLSIKPIIKYINSDNVYYNLHLAHYVELIGSV